LIDKLNRLDFISEVQPVSFFFVWAKSAYAGI